MSSKSDWEQICYQVQERLLISPLEVESAKALWGNLFKCLIAACDDDFLETKRHEINNLLKMKEDEKNKGIIAITGGKKTKSDLKRFPILKDLMVAGSILRLQLTKILNLLKLLHLTLKSDF